MPLNSSQLITLACQKAKVPGMTQQAGLMLNMILGDLAQAYDFGLASTFIQFNMNVPLGSGPIVMPADFLRVRPEGFFFVYNGVPYILISIELAEFDALVQQGGIQNFPEFYAMDFSTTPVSCFVWPPPNGAYFTTIRYFKQPQDIATPETSTTVPWFPNQKTILHFLTSAMQELADDDKADATQLKGEAALTKYLKMKDDPEGRAKKISLDRRSFGRSFNRIPNTKTIGWAIIGCIGASLSEAWINVWDGVRMLLS